MIRTLLGYLHPTHGSATVLGMDVVADSVEIRRRTGYLPGGIALYDSLSGADALDYLAALQDQGAPLREELCERLQMPASVLRRRVRDYSRGMRQKIGVIQALQHDPELAILDEPTEGLDPLMQQAFYALMDDQRAKGRTIFFSSHVLSEVERMCDRVAIIRAGHLMALQNVDDLLARRKRKVQLRWRGVAPDLAGVPGPGGREGRRRSDDRHAAGRRLGLRAGHRLAIARGSDDRAGTAGRGVPGVLRRGRGERGGARMNLRLLLQTLRWNRVRLLALIAASFGWGILMPVVYASFSDALKQLANSGTIPKEFFNFGSGQHLHAARRPDAGPAAPARDRVHRHLRGRLDHRRDRRRAAARHAGGAACPTRWLAAPCTSRSASRRSS